MVRVENLPIVGFTFTVDGFSLQFTDTTVGVVENWLWDFGDGNTSKEQHPLHTYTEAGTYSVVLTVWNAGGENSLAMPVEVTYVLWLPGINK
jgi:PKD repeat protein